MRKILVDGKEYKWCMTTSGSYIRGPGFNRPVSIADITGNHNDLRDMEKGNASVTPGMVVAYIKKNR